MTVEELKQQYSMPDILMQYGLKSNGIKKNISCPFHADKNPSMQIFKDGFNCHSCGKHGDIIKFVQLINNCSFKDAFLSLGGTYENIQDDFFAKQRLEKAKFEREKRIKAEIRQKQLKLDISNLIEYYRSNSSKVEPLGDIWCECQHHLFYLLYAWEEKYIKGEEVDINGVIMRHSRSEFIGNIIR